MRLHDVLERYNRYTKTITSTFAVLAAVGAVVLVLYQTFVISKISQLDCNMSSRFISIERDLLSVIIEQLQIRQGDDQRNLTFHIAELREDSSITQENHDVEGMKNLIKNTRPDDEMERLRRLWESSTDDLEDRTKKMIANREKMEKYGEIGCLAFVDEMRE